MARLSAAVVAAAAAAAVSLAAIGTNDELVNVCRAEPSRSRLSPYQQRD